MRAVDATVPYPWPYDAEAGTTFDPSRLALIVAGGQAQWSCLPEGARVLSGIESLAQVLRVNGVLVVFVRHGRSTGSPKRASTDLPVVGTADWELAITVQPEDWIVDTPGYDAFRSGSIEADLAGAGRDRLLFAGLAYETTVDTTLRSANDRGFECLTMTDLVAHIDPAVGERALSSITMSGGIFGAVGDSTAVRAAIGVPIEEPQRGDATS